MGANSLTPWDALNTLTSNSIGGRRVYLVAVLEKQGKVSKWEMNPSQQTERKKLESQIEFLDLAEGFAVYKEYIAGLNIAELELLAEKERVQNTGLTRKQKLKRIENALEKVTAEKEKMAAE